MEMNKIFQGNCLEIIKTFDDKSINCVITSPPYWQLRDYGWTGQWGLEKTYQEYLEHLWQLMDEIYRVLKDDGTVWINLGDTYNNTPIGRQVDPLRIESYQFKKITDKNIAHKCLLLIPHRFAIGCIDRNWILRNDIIWAKRNGMPESVTDRFSKKHEYIFFMVKSEKYYFDLDSIRDKHKDVSLERIKHSWKSEHDSIGDIDVKTMGDRFCNPLGKNPGSVSDFWDITTKSSSDKHYATFNSELINKPIIAGCPEGGTILDPFCGSGTTLARAKELNRNYVGIEGNAEYIKIAESKLKQDNLL